MRRLCDWVYDRLADLAWRIELWEYERRSARVEVRRSCGHLESLLLLRKGMKERVMCYESTPCPRCNFYAVMKEFYGKSA